LVAGKRGRLVYEAGDVDRGIWSVGVSIGLVNDIPTCEELLKRMVREAEEVINGMSRIRVESQAQARL
jgi:NAD(P)H-dependent flavin oxidoreductase YrpB (nitropropane dioxygenase family)